MKSANSPELPRNIVWGNLVTAFGAANLVLGLIPALLAGSLSVGLLIAAEDSVPPNTPQIDYGLNPKLGALPTDNIQFRPQTSYLQAETAAADARLQKIKDLGRSTNYLTEMTKALEAIIASDASTAIKGDARKLAVLELAYQQEKAGEAQPGDGHLERALQLLAEYVERYPKDAIIPEVLLRQGRICRHLSLADQAIDRFYMVIRSAPRVEGKNLEYYRRLILMAQSEIADTQEELGRHAESAELYQRLLNSRSEEVNIERVRMKCLRALSLVPDHQGVLEQAEKLLADHPESEFAPEVRYVYATSLRKLGRTSIALEQLQLLLESIELAPPSRRASWMTWKLRVGNELANELYLGGDFSNALLLYRSLLTVSTNSIWKHPVLYQIGLCEERLSHGKQASDAYRQILSAPRETNSVPTKLIQDMAGLRLEVLKTAEVNLKAIENAP